MTDIYEPEEIGPDAPGYPRFDMYMKDFQVQRSLSNEELTWFITHIGKHVPFHFLILWQHFPEWELSRLKLEELQMMLGVGQGERHKRILELIVHNKVVARTDHL